MKGLLGERMFSLYDLNSIGNVNLEDFKNTSFKFFDPSFDSKLSLVFDIYDFNEDGFVAEEDIRSILSHIPIDLIVFKLFIILI